MATVYGAGRTKVLAVPSQKVNPGEAGGKLQVVYDEYTFLAEMAANDIIEMQLVVPAGARIVEAGIVCPSTGATGIFQLGTSGDADALVASADAGGQAVKALADAAAADLMKEVSAETSYQVKCTELTAAATGLKLKAFVSYIQL